MVLSHALPLSTRGDGDIQDITGPIAGVVHESGLHDGVVTVFCPGSTGALTTIEFESGALEDLRESLDRIAPRGRAYRHHLRWGCDNGHSHVLAALVGPSLSIPFVEGRLTLGTWQQIVFLEFDTRPRSRQLTVMIVGE